MNEEKKFKYVVTGKIVAKDPETGEIVSLKKGSEISLTPSQAKGRLYQNRVRIHDSDRFNIVNAVVEKSNDAPDKEAVKKPAGK